MKVRGMQVVTWLLQSAAVALLVLGLLIAPHDLAFGQTTAGATDGCSGAICSNGCTAVTDCSAKTATCGANPPGSNCSACNCGHTRFDPNGFCQCLLKGVQG